MSYIFKVHENLFLGGYWPVFDLHFLKKEGIKAIVNLMEEDLYDPTPMGFSYLYKGFPDDWYPPHHFFTEILDFIDAHIQQGPVLCHCARGVSRSGGIIIAWLLRTYPEFSWKNAHDYVNKSRLVFPSIEIKQAILDYFESLEGTRRE